jgi:hypothetical protein
MSQNRKSKGGEKREMPHEPWISVWTHGSDIIRRGSDDKLHHFSLDVEKLSKTQLEKMHLLDETTTYPNKKQYSLDLDAAHEIVSFGKPDYDREVFHVSGTVTEKNEAPKDFGMSNLVAVAVLDFAHNLPIQTRNELVALLESWIVKLKPPMLGIAPESTP